MTPGLPPRFGVAAVVAVLAALTLAALSSRQATAPTPADRPSVGVALGGGVFGIEPTELDDDFERLAAGGVEWVRLDVDWSVAEPAPGFLRWDEPDRVIAQADAAGLEVLVMLGYTPPWARPEGAGDKHPPDDVGRFETFAALAGARYGEVVDAWEIWNEPNLQAFWESGPDPAVYAEVFTAALDGLRSAGVDEPILLGGLAPADDELPRGLSAETFLTEVFDALAIDARPDAVAIHPYSYPARPGGTQRWNLFSRLPAIHDLVTSRAGDDVSLWLTEFGAPTDGGDRAVDEETQADDLVEALECVAHWPWAENLFVFTLRDSPAGAADDVEPHFGLFRSDGSAKPAWPSLVDRLAAPFVTSASPCGD